jgi:hypothetical protein
MEPTNRLSVDIPTSELSRLRYKCQSIGLKRGLAELMAFGVERQFLPSSLQLEALQRRERLLEKRHVISFVVEKHVFETVTTCHEWCGVAIGDWMQALIVADLDGERIDAERPSGRGIQAAAVRRVEETPPGRNKVPVSITLPPYIKIKLDRLRGLRNVSDYVAHLIAKDDGDLCEPVEDELPSGPIGAKQMRVTLRLSSDEYDWVMARPGGKRRFIQACVLEKRAAEWL